MKAFDNNRYFDSQMQAFYTRMEGKDFSNTLIEFGGKGRGDYHASRVLPGYDPDIKGKILQGLSTSADIIMVLNAMDIFHMPDGRTLNGRVRGDTGLQYGYEVFRKIEEGNVKFSLGIKKWFYLVTLRINYLQ